MRTLFQLPTLRHLVLTDIPDWNRSFPAIAPLVELSTTLSNNTTLEEVHFSMDNIAGADYPIAPAIAHLFAENNTLQRVGFSLTGMVPSTLLRNVSVMMDGLRRNASIEELEFAFNLQFLDHEIQNFFVAPLRLILPTNLTLQNFTLIQRNNTVAELSGDVMLFPKLNQAGRGIFINTPLDDRE
jgi:hypothetical protein